MERSILKWELIGIIVISVIGAILHFLFELSGEWYPVGVIAAVNESVWEHFKIGFWPALIYGIVEYPYLQRMVNNFFIAKAIGIYAIPITIAVLFYSYTAIVGEDFLLADILIFIIAIVIGQLTSYKILTSRQWPSWFNGLGLILIIILVFQF